MKNTLFYLSTCSTCTRIIKELEPDKTFYMQDIKTENITERDLDEIAQKSGGYEQLFSRRAMKYKSMGLKDKHLSEADYKQLILEEYTFLKRPVIVVNDSVFVGNSKEVIEAAKAKMKK